MALPISTEPTIDDFTFTQGASSSIPWTFWGQTGWNRALDSLANINSTQANMLRAFRSGLVGPRGVKWSGTTTVSFTAPVAYTKIRFGNSSLAPTGWRMRLTDNNDVFADVLATAADATTAEWSLAPTNSFAPVDLSIIKSIYLVWAGTTGVAVFLGAGGAEPHLVTIDGSRLEVYHDGVYRLYETDDVIVNMAVRDTFITHMAVFERGALVARVRYDVDNSMQLHANALVVEAGDFAHGGDSIDVRVGKNHVVRVEAKYRSFSIQNDDAAETVHAGGCLALVVTECELNDARPGVRRDVTRAQFRAHALACDAHFPHIVTFDGGSIIPGKGDDHLLFACCGVQVRAATDDFSRLLRLWVVVGEQIAWWAEWTRTSEGVTTLETAASSEKITTSNSATEATRFVDYTIELENGGCELLVRAQANGAASFALRGAALKGPQCGLLVGMGGCDIISMEPATGASSSVLSAYENIIEPHLAWARGTAAGTASEAHGGALVLC